MVAKTFRNINILNRHILANMRNRQNVAKHLLIIVLPMRSITPVLCREGERTKELDLSPPRIKSQPFTYTAVC